MRFLTVRGGMVAQTLTLATFALALLAIAFEQAQWPATPLLLGVLVSVSLQVVASRPVRPAWFPHRLRSENARRIQAAQILADASPTPILITNMNGVILYRNAADRRCFGWADQHQRWRERLVDARSAAEALAAARDGQPWGRTLRLVPTHQPPQETLVDVSPLLDAQGLPLVCWISQQSAPAPTEIRESPPILLANPVPRPSVLANVSHEIRTPLTSMIGFTDFLLEELDEREGSPEAIAAADTIRRNGQHLLKIVNDILDFAKVQSGTVKIDQRTCRLADIAREVSDTFRQRFQETGVQFDVILGRFLPAVIHTDPTRLRQIIFNLVGNAFKFTQQGHVRVTFELPAVDPKRLTVTVEDTGPGISAVLLPQLFVPFSQGKGVPSSAGGTGLGLSISKQLAQALGGDVTVESQLGVGTTFVVSIDIGSIDGVPLTVPGSRPTRESRSTLQSIVDQVPRGLRILAAEDSVDNQHLLSFLLKKIEAETHLVGDGQQAVAAHQQGLDDDKPFDLILMDIEMPLMNGLEATQAIRAIDPQTPILALSAHVMAGDQARCQAVGCQGHIGKPIDRETFYSTILQVCPRPHHENAMADSLAY